MAYSFQNPDGSQFAEVDGPPPSVSAPLTGATITMKWDQRSLYLNPAGTLAELTILLPLGPSAGDRVFITSSQEITALTLQDGFGNAIADPSALAAGVEYVLRYIDSDIGWAYSVPSVDAIVGLTASAAELNYNDIAVLGTGAASKAVVLDAGEDYTWPATGVLTYGVLKDPAGTTLGATAAEINNVADVSARVQELTASGAVTAGKQSVELNHDTVVIAATIADAANHQGLFVVKDTSSGGTAAHTLTLTAGTFDGTNNVATLNAPNECLIVYFDSAGNGTIVENVGGVALS